MKLACCANVPCEADKHGASGAIVVLWLVKQSFDILADSVEISLLALGLRHLDGNDRALGMWGDVESLTPDCNTWRPQDLEQSLSCHRAEAPRWEYRGPSSLAIFLVSDEVEWVGLRT
jgi:hypothetical protein